MKQQHTSLSINILAITASLLWASAFLAGKITLQYLPPLHLASYRLMIAGIMLLIYTRKNPFKGLKGHITPLLLLTLFQTIIVFRAFNLGLNLVDGSFGAIIIGSSPAVTSIIAVIAIKDEKFTSRKIIGLIIGLSSIIILTLSKESNSMGGENNVLGASLLFLCNISSALGSIIVRKRFSSFDPIRINNAQIFIGSVVVYIIAIIAEPNTIIEIPLQGIMSLLYLSFITAGAVSIWMILVAKNEVKISSIAMWKFLIPSVGALLNWIINPLDNPTFLSVCAIIGIVIAILISVSDTSITRNIKNQGIVELKEPVS